MGRDGRGVRAVSDSSIEITFMYHGVRCRERFSLKPTATNLKLAERYKNVIEHDIATGVFDYLATFPNSPRAARFAPEVCRENVAGFLTRWLTGKKKHVSSSTYDGYRKIVELRLVPALGTVLVVDLKRKIVRDWLDTAVAGSECNTVIELKREHHAASPRLLASLRPSPRSGI
ncbi:DUF3596 domain-containing protein [Pseudomonas gessardii]|uniref:DUF3596 domain-containing protein n=1 Tax=Pseudomonas gessardii TaxID=78544 RepID=A0A7Y1QPU7_9PSED|nr:DUF3596 domain-containing protein [Pseudomonas gessardii]